MGGRPIITAEEMINNFLELQRNSIKAEYSPELKVIAYQEKNENRENCLNKRMYDYLEKNSKNSEEVRKLYKEVRCIKHFSNLQGFLLETFGGYKRI